MDSKEPVSDQVYHILLSLLDGPRHGYAIIQAVEARTRGTLTIGSGTLYSAIKRMEVSGWVERVARPPGEDARRKYYGLTRAGRRLTRAEAERHSLLARYGRDLLPELGSS